MNNPKISELNDINDDNNYIKHKKQTKNWKK